MILNGRAVHLDAAREWNEHNWGLGVEREFDSDERWVKVALANGFKDSLGNPSFMAGGSIKRRFRAPRLSDDFYVDVGVVVETANDEYFRRERGAVAQNVNFAIRDGLARSFLDTNNVHYAVAPGNAPQQSIADIAEGAQRFTGTILCYQ